MESYLYSYLHSKKRYGRHARIGETPKGTHSPFMKRDSLAGICKAANFKSTSSGRQKAAEGGRMVCTT